MNKKPKNIKLLVILGSCIVVLILGFLSLKNILRKNEFGEEIKIDNFSNYYKNVPQKTQDSIYNTLYNIVSINTDDKATIPKNGALIRDNEHKENFDKKTNVHSGEFIVDIESIKQSYSISFYWSDKEDSRYISGYTTTASCLSENLNIYDFNTCVDGNTSYNNLITKYPLIQVLPINVEYFSDNYTSYTKYSITYSVSNDKVIINISDYSGGSHEKALKSISDRGYNLKDYTIEYKDLSSSY